MTKKDVVGLRIFQGEEAARQENARSNDFQDHQECTRASLRSSTVECIDDEAMIYALVGPYVSFEFDLLTLYPEFRVYDVTKEQGAVFWWVLKPPSQGLPNKRKKRKRIASSLRN